MAYSAVQRGKTKQYFFHGFSNLLCMSNTVYKGVATYTLATVSMETHYANYHS